MIFTSWWQWLKGRVPDRVEKTQTAEDSLTAILERKVLLTNLLAESAQFEAVVNSPIGQALRGQLDGYLQEASALVLNLLSDPVKYAADLQRLRAEVTVAKELRALFDSDGLADARRNLEASRDRVSAIQSQIQDIESLQPHMGKGIA